ncbi:MAG: hypothetical protein IJN05_06390 [Ruminococcus sp.]|nr:hypothetical protein [Ruminococcus sp.]
MVTKSLLSEKLENFRNLYGEHWLLSRLRKKYPDVADNCDLSCSHDVQNNKQLCFDDEWERSLDTIKFILDNAICLKEQYNEIFRNSGDGDVYVRTVDNLISRLKKITEKSQNSSKTADGISKAIQATIIKNYCCNQLKDFLDKYMDECGFKRIELEIGKKIDDNDLDYIENCIRVDVNDKELHNTIINKTHDAYVFRCYDSEEDELFDKIIPGGYSIGSYKE